MNAGYVISKPKMAFVYVFEFVIPVDDNVIGRVVLACCGAGASREILSVVEDINVDGGV
jgi:hypothetical protein